MNKDKDKYVFSPLTASLDRSKLNNRKCQGDKYIKHFTYWNQSLALMFGQLSNRETLRDLVVAIEVLQSKRYHLGMGGKSIVKKIICDCESE